MRLVRFRICTAIFLLLTLVKLISPAAAVEIRGALRPLLNRNDDYKQVVHRMKTIIMPIDFSSCEPYDPHPPLTELRRSMAQRTNIPVDLLPKTAELSKTGSNNAQDPALSYGIQAREAFLNAQAQLTDEAPPDQVSYEVVKLPFVECSPIAGKRSSGFGYRIHPIYGDLRFHYGTDFAADYETEIHAFADGTVIAAGTDDGYGNYLMVDHGDGFVSLYGHCSGFLVSEGETVLRGQTIALVGSTGQSTGPHLHFELMHDGVYLNPEFYLYA